MNKKHSRWQHHHVFHEASRKAERSTHWVLAITLVMMVVEIVAGYGYNSMALLADGWHMSSHALAIGLSAFAYWASRHYSQDIRFTFGTWKIEVLAGFTSAILLLGVAGTMVFGSLERLISPQQIHYQEAVVVAIIGLLVNLVCALILGGGHGHNHSHGHQHHGHQHHGHDHHDDLNLKSAYIHVLADAATSVLAIAALLCGWYWGWAWLDPIIGLVGAVLVTVWAIGLLRETGRVLLDSEMDHPVADEVREAILEHAEWGSRCEIADLHVWRVGKQQFAVVLGLISHFPPGESITADAVRAVLAQHEELVHVTVEINHCQEC